MSMSPVDFRVIVHLHVKPECIKTFRDLVNHLIDEMRGEPNFANAFVLEDEEDPTKFIFYETWVGTKDEFLKVQMSREYRKKYEKSLSELLSKPHESQYNWQLVRTEYKEPRNVPGG